MYDIVTVGIDRLKILPLSCYPLFSPDSSLLLCRLVRTLDTCTILNCQYPSQSACLHHNMHISWLAYTKDERLFLALLALTFGACVHIYLSCSFCASIWYCYRLRWVLATLPFRIESWWYRRCASYYWETLSCRRKQTSATIITLDWVIKISESSTSYAR